MEKAKVGLIHRVEIFKKNGQVHLKLYHSFFTSSELNFLYAKDLPDGKKNPLGYFWRLALSRFQNNRAFKDPRVRKLYARMENSLNAGAEDINLESEHPLPTLADLRRDGFTSCDMQDHFNFDVDSFEEKTLAFVLYFVDSQENLCLCFSRFGNGRLRDDEVWKKRCEKIRRVAREERGGCTSDVCERLNAQIKELGGLSRLNSVEGGTKILSKRRKEKNEAKAALKKHVLEHHGERKQFQILEMLDEMKELSDWSRARFGVRDVGDGMNLFSLMDEESLDKMGDRTQMFMNGNDLSRRAEMVEIESDEEVPPDFFALPTIQETFKDLRPYHIRLKEYACERGQESQYLSGIGDDFSQVGHVFDWKAHMNDDAEFALPSTSDVYYGILYICPNTAWGIDLLIDARWSDESHNDVVVFTHPLRPINDAMGWDVQSSLCLIGCVRECLVTSNVRAQEIQESRCGDSR